MRQLVQALTGENTEITWGVVMTVCEPQALVQTNVLWHLATGARAVHVFFDDPQDRALPAVREIAGCHVVACDRGYWRGLTGKKGRPASQMRRQTLNANTAQAVAMTDWLFHVDADEFIWQDGDLLAELTALGLGQTEMNLPVFERMFDPGRPQATLFGGAFRVSSHLAGADAGAAFGAFSSLMKRGQYSHGAGKSGVAVRQGLRLGVHNATIRGQHRWKRAPKAISRTARLLHFDGLTPLHWVMKFLRYRLNRMEVQQAVLQPHRADQIAWMLGQGATVSALERAHAELFDLTPERRARLEAFDLIEDICFDPVAACGVQCPDMSPTAFDADLWARNPWLEAMLDPPQGV